MTFTQTVREEIADKKARMGKKRAFVRDCFLQSGVISNPNRTYHLEFTLDEQKADELINILETFELHPKKFARNTNFVVYLKGSEEISDVLKVIRADKSLLAFEDVRVKRDLANCINRQNNCETANQYKTIDAAQNQLEAIRYIAKTKGLSFLSKQLEEVAKHRLQNEELTLAEIAEILTISKSGVNHRMRKICKIAETIREKEL